MSRVKEMKIKKTLIWEDETKIAKIKSDFSLDQFIIEEVEKDKVDEYYENLKNNLTKKYNFDNLEIGESRAIDIEYCEDTAILTSEIVWTNIDEILTKTEDEITEIIKTYVDFLWLDDRTINILSDIEIIVK